MDQRTWHAMLDATADGLRVLNNRRASAREYAEYLDSMAKTIGYETVLRKSSEDARIAGALDANYQGGADEDIEAWAAQTLRASTWEHVGECEACYGPGPLFRLYGDPNSAHVCVECAEEAAEAWEEEEEDYPYPGLVRVR